jgi:hypothetical protein
MGRVSFRQTIQATTGIGNPVRQVLVSFLFSDNFSVFVTSCPNRCCFPQFRVLKSGFLKVEVFDTESQFDILTVNGRDYSGTDGPNGVTVQPDTAITWSSDGSINDPGFKVCLVVSSVPTPSPTDAPSSLPTVTSEPTQPLSRTAFSLVSGPCSVAERVCFLSPNYPSDYGYSQFCEASIGCISPLSRALFHPSKLFLFFFSVPSVEIGSSPRGSVRH